MLEEKVSSLDGLERALGPQTIWPAEIFIKGNRPHYNTFTT